MPYKPAKPCAYPGCPRLTHGRYCAEHARIEQSDQREQQRRYEETKRDKAEHSRRYGRKWREIRDRYIHKHPLCEMCLREGRYTQAEDVHHIRPLSEGGTNSESNLMSLCHSCHSRLHAERGDRRARRQGRERRTD